MGRRKEVATDVETSQTPAKKSRKPRAVREHASDTSQAQLWSVDAWRGAAFGSVDRRSHQLSTVQGTRKEEHCDGKDGDDRNDKGCSAPQDIRSLGPAWRSPR
ncbi:hypothetical protein RvY_01955-4 [Ramazzottius varieornatus]|uniref:Uncharacterized protein n=1 Tax=Ramazzottius varieornatus TaxID=947166 RepID=A0A1D1UIY0_RAMVA|nr:hypothetical protein RvY_01955-4 [Ramazzottius varieornatus]